jgi:hypothetical protein
MAQGVRMGDTVIRGSDMLMTEQLEAAAGAGHYVRSGGSLGVGPAEPLAAHREDQDEVVCDRRVFTEVEDRDVLKERITRLVEHHPVAKDYVTTVK